MTRIVPTVQNTYRLNLNLTAPGNIFAEIVNPPDSGRVLRLRKLTVLSGSTVNVSAERRTTASLGSGTATPPVKSDTTQSDSLMTCQTFTVAPTAGTLIDTPYLVKVPANLLAADVTSTAEFAPVALRPGEYLTLSTNAAASLVGHVAWTEESG